jgi:predicted transcriptional regulator
MPSSPSPADRSAKQASLRLIERLDDDATFDDILYELYFLQKVERGRRDVENGRTVPHEQVREEFDQWLS